MSAGELGLGTQRTFQQANDAKHTAKGVETRVANNNISLLESRHQSDSEFVERTEDQSQPGGPGDYEREDWSKIPAEMCEKLVTISKKNIF